MSNITDTLPGGLHGSSGATIKVGRYIVWKSGPRADEQSVYLLYGFHKNTALPEVISRSRDGYTMERLYDEPDGVLPGLHTTEHKFSDVMNALNVVWVSGHINPLAVDLAAHQDKVLGLCAKCDIEGRTASLLNNIMHDIAWHQLRAVLTHGDPTVDNLMYRGQTPVLIDPIPATNAVPDLECVDIGKVGQSAMGYEAARYGTGTPEVFEDFFDTYMSGTTNEHLARRYWTSIHLLRALPYMPEERKKNVRELFYEATRRI